MANPVLLIVLGVVALVAAVAAAIYYWDDWTTALMNTEAFKWVVDQLKAVSDWFGSMGGWSSMAKAAWDGIASIFQNAINGLVEMLNKIPGVSIDAHLGSLTDSLPDGGDRAMAAKESMNSSVGSLSPNRPTAVPQGGLLKTIQNTTQTQNKGTHVENVNIHTAKPMTPMELENMISMGVAG